LRNRLHDEKSPLDEGSGDRSRRGFFDRRS
jgi:hypothetical protein